MTRIEDIILKHLHEGPNDEKWFFKVGRYCTKLETYMRPLGGPSLVDNRSQAYHNLHVTSWRVKSVQWLSPQIDSALAILKATAHLDRTPLRRSFGCRQPPPDICDVTIWLWHLVWSYKNKGLCRWGRVLVQSSYVPLHCMLWNIESRWHF